MSAALEEKIDALAARLDRIEHAMGLNVTAFPAPPAILDVPGKKSQRAPAFWDDAEVRAWVDEHLWKMSLDRLASAAIARFGRGRAPSRSALHRYRDGLRKAARARRSTRP
ncbi:MAG: hypothetical protein Kow00114_22520 [Kiloniellaceae bacterium]